MTLAVATQLKPYQPSGKRKKSRRTTRVIDDPHLEFVRNQYCCVCGAPPRSHPHHVKHRASNGSDRLTVPLCPRHHTDVHMSRRKFAKAHNVNLDDKAVHYWTISPANPANQPLAAE